MDIAFIRKNPDVVKKAVKDKQLEGTVDVDRLLELEEKRRGILGELEEKRAEQNRLSDRISTVHKPEARETLITLAKQVKEDVQNLEIEFKKLDAVYVDLLVHVPNITSEEMPVGQGEKDNRVLKVWMPTKGYVNVPEDIAYIDTSYMPESEFEYRDHVDLGESLDIIDVKQSALVSGSRFCYLKNEAVLLQDAIIALLKKRLQSLGYMPMIPPVLVRERALFGTSHFPEGKEQVYKIENSNVEEKQELYLVGSSEPANFSYFMDKVLDEPQLPIKLYAQTACFRSEVGSWGKDVRGIKRVHQFDKLEMNALCSLEQSRAIFEEFLATNEWLLQELKLPYRVVNKCTGDCGYNASYLQYDVEIWRPGEKEFMEAMTDTMTTDYQARRLNIRYKGEEGLNYVHTVNDTGVALGRMIIAIVENYQQKNGSVKVPKVLQPYMNGLKEIKKN